MPAGSDARPRVALVSDTTEFAGAELYAVVLVEALRDRYDFVAVVGEHAAEETRRRLRVVGADIEVVPGLRRRPSPAAIRRLRKALDRVDPALVHVNLSDQGDGLAPLLAIGRSGRWPSLATLHLVLPDRARWREALSRALIRRVDTTIGVSDSVGAYVTERGLRGAVVKNGLPKPEPASDPRSALGLDGSALVVGGIGRLHRQKGWDVLCRAASIVRRERPEVVFIVIGEGPERDRLEALDGARDVRFVGRRSQAATLIPAFDILVAPSRFEGLGLVAVESMYLGVSVVASDIAGLGEVLGDCAVLVPPDDPEALASGILRLAADPGLRAELSMRGAERARDLFSVERMAVETLRVYESVAGRRAGSGATLSA